jgi:serine/threonine protein kinase
MGFTYQFKSQSSYRFKKFLGSGGSADVLLYTRKSPGLPEQDIVLKVLKTSDESTFNELINDGNCLSLLQHPNILSTFGFERLDRNKLALVLEYFPGQSLSKLVSQIASDHRKALASHIITSTLQALETAHKSGIIHGDVSSRNILVSEQGHVKLADFGLATITAMRTSSEAEKLKGSIDYLAPERWKGISSSEQSDIFSLGIVACEVLTGQSCLKNIKVSSGYETVMNFLEARPWQNLPEWCAFFDLALAANPENRIKASELLILVPQASASTAELQNFLSKISLSTSALSSETVKTVAIQSVMFGQHISMRLKKEFLAVMLAVGTLIFCQPVPCEEAATGKLQTILLTLTSRPWGSVTIDRQFKGYTPLVRLKLSPGYHEIVWHSPKGTEVKRTLQAYNTKDSHYKLLLEDEKSRK